MPERGKPEVLIGLPIRQSGFYSARVILSSGTKLVAAIAAAG